MDYNQRIFTYIQHNALPGQTVGLARDGVMHSRIMLTVLDSQNDTAIHISNHHTQ